ncbi:MAG: hypothetical protein H6722_27525 [Sandaracinus sp.]|nr:hypothetical protein [Sandaracinus sp.]
MPLGSLFALGLALLGPDPASIDDPWDVAPTVYRLDPTGLPDEADERGYHRTLRLHVVLDAHLPIEANLNAEEHDDYLDFAMAGGLALELPILTVTSVGVSASYLFWRYGTDELYDDHGLHGFEAGGFARVHFMTGFLRAFVGAHAGVSFLATEGGRWGRYVGPHVGIAFVGKFGMELTIGGTRRDFRGEVPVPSGRLDAQASLHFFFHLQSPR